MKKLLLSIFIVFIIPFTVYAASVPEVDKEKKIYDYADVLTIEEENELYDSVTNFIKDKNLDLALVTIDDNPFGNYEEDSEEYASKFYEENDFGIGEDKSGLLILLDFNSEYSYILTYGDARIVYPDSKLENISLTPVQILTNGKYYEALKTYLSNLNDSYNTPVYTPKNTTEQIDAKGYNYFCDSGNTKLEPCNDGNIRIPVVDTSKKVYDFGDYLTDDEESRLREKINTYIDKYNMDLVFVIIKTNPYGVSDYFTQVYSQDFYDYNGFGVGNTKDGTIVLIDMDNRYPFITTTGNAILVYDDQRINSIHDRAYDYLASESFFDAFNSYLSGLSSYADSGIPDSNKYFCIDDSGNYYKCKEAPKSVNWTIATASGIILTLIIVLIHLSKYKGIKLATNANYYLKNSTITNSKDNFLTTFTSRVKIQRDSGGSGGHGGGSSISHGSSGTSHGGGGGRHF